MIYITFDTNIWVYRLSDSWKTENELDYLEYWLESGQVKILLPEIIREEWDKHKNIQASERRKDLKNFFKMANEILPTEFFKEYTTPDSQQKIVDQQLERINRIIDTAIWIPLSVNIKEIVINNGIEKKAPMHKKSSVADAVIIYSLFEFAEQNPENDYFFVSGNTEDFYEKHNGKSSIHSDLKTDFDNLKINAYKELNRLKFDLENRFNLTIKSDFEAKRTQALKNKIKKQIYNPHYESLAKNSSNLFFQNKKMLDFILKEDSPTKEQVIFVLSLIDSDQDYEKYFYGNVHGKVWFNILLQKDIFNSNNNPTNHNHWLPLVFLQNLAKAEKENDTLSKIIDIIQNVSEKSHENRNTWWQFVRILSLMPSQNIPLDIFEYVPKWINGNAQLSTTVHQICDGLIPKLIKESPKRKNKKKIATIIKHFLEISKKEKTEKESFSFESIFISPIERLTDTFDDKLISIIVSSCPKEVISHLIEQLKRIYYTFPNGLIFEALKDEVEVKINLSIDTNQKSIEVLPENGESFEISDFDKKSESKLKNELIDKLSLQGFEPTLKDGVSGLDYSLQFITVGLSFLFGSYGVEEYKTQHNNEKVEFAFVSILLDLINKYVQEKPKLGLVLLSNILEKEEYRLVVLRQVCLFIIGNNWDITKGLFLEKLQKGQINEFFYKSIFQTDLYRFLKKNQLELSVEALQKLDEIIENPPSKIKDDNLDNWQLRWYSALKDTALFKEKYNNLAKKLKYSSEHFDTIGRMQYSSGDISPLTISDLEEITNSEIVEYINKFKPTRDFAAPSISGLGRSLQNAVKQNPQKFSDNINDFISLPYVYVYYIIYGFYYAWQEKNTFCWQKVLDFCIEYINNEKFYTNELKIEDDLRADADWVVGVISNLLQEGMRSDDHSMGISLLPKAKIILITFSKWLKPESNKKPNKDYPSYSLNSTAGKILRGLLDYSLCNARNNLKTSSVKWEREIVDIFENSLENRIIDSYILIGMYYKQFLYLSQSWTLEKSISFQALNDYRWEAFWSGYLFSGFVPNKQDYPKYIPHYEKALLTPNNDSGLYGNGIKHHITTFYFWEYENISDNGLITKYCKKASADNINDFVNYVSHQDEYLKSLKSAEEIKLFENRIIELWTFLIKRFIKTKDKKEQEILSRLCKMASLVQELNKEVTSLILVSCPNIDKSHSTSNLLKNLVRLSKSGIPKETAEYVGEIISSVPVDSFSFYRNEEVKDIIVFLFENEQRKVALKFCDDRLRLGDESFNDLIDKYK
ncbi:PIN domain-containing protein [Cellulophaga baltica]|nr:PIN domain-containing protein [Cellulophaga baltica]